MNTYRLVLAGFGAVGRGFATIVHERGAWLAERYGLHLSIVGVATRSRGSVYAPDGIDLGDLLAATDLRHLPGGSTEHTLDLIARAEADVLLELSPTDLATAEPAMSHLRAATARGMHLVIVNKGPAALHLRELRQLTAEQDLFLGYEGVVMAGTPSLRMGLNDLAGCEVLEVRGIVNGTTNYILTEMERGLAYADALAEAQRLGYAETDPSGDVEGHDAAGKAAILANILMGADMRPADVVREGITGLTGEAVAEAAAAGEHWKLIARVWRDDLGVHASVRPTRLPLSHPLAGVSGAMNALTFSTDLLGDVTLIGPGAGGTATGFAVLSDLLALHRGGWQTAA